jgi:hypothetical protein
MAHYFQRNRVYWNWDLFLSKASEYIFSGSALEEARGGRLRIGMRSHLSGDLPNIPLCYRLAFNYRGGREETLKNFRRVPRLPYI